MESVHYGLSWLVDKDSPLTEDAINDAYSVVQRVVGHSGFPVDVQLKCPTGGQPHVTFNGSANFGFPPPHFIERLSPRELTALEAGHLSRDGWLSLHGTGQGSMTTDKTLIDFPARLFLCVLVGRCGLSVADDDGCKLASRFALPPSPERFAWFPKWEPALKEAVQRHWLVDGQIARFNNTEADELAGHYAW